MIYLQLLAHSSRELQAAKIGVADWVQVTIALIAALAIIIPLVKSWYSSFKEKEAVRSALVQEMLANMHSLFNEGIERPFLFKVFESFLSQLSSKVKDESEFQKLISLYTDLMDFRAVTDMYWPALNKQNSDEIHLICTEKQVVTINKFLQYFGEKTVVLDPRDLEKLETARDKARLLRNKSQKKWHSMLVDNVDKII